MRFEFKWSDDQNQPKKFQTSDPETGETMMRSKSDFPTRSSLIQKQFDQLYGQEKGKFQDLLRRAAEDELCSLVQAGIDGLSIRIHRGASQVFDLSDRPNSYL
jgi:hypothetical protein